MCDTRCGYITVQLVFTLSALFFGLTAVLGGDFTDLANKLELRLLEIEGDTLFKSVTSTDVWRYCVAGRQ